MKNPYEAETAVDRVTPGRPWLVGFALAFGAFLLLPLAVRIGAPGDSSPVPAGESAGAGLRERLRSLEGRLEAQPLFEKWRRRDQAVLIRVFREGNRRVVIGRDGWLHYRADLDAVFGKGPRYVEPTTVARGPVDDSWQPPIPLIASFAAQLEARGIELVLAPVPTKAMLQPGGFGRSGNTVAHPDYRDILDDLRNAGIETVDLLPVLGGIPRERDRFLKQDTHWTPLGMERSARAVAGRIRSGPDAADPEKAVEIREVERTHRGDLVGMLDAAGSETLFPLERQTLRQVIDPGTGAPPRSDPEAEVVLLGDSFVNVYDDPALGFGDDEETAIGGGFASHFAAALGEPVHVVAINGGGATGVRRAFASLPDDVVRSKEIVVWVFSARDLILAELPARRAGIEWRPVEWNPERSDSAAPASGALTVIGTLAERSQFGDPGETPYASAVHSAIFTDIEVEEGSYDGEEIYAFSWAFRDRQLEPTARLEAGKRYRLELIPFDEAKEAATATRLDDFFRPDLRLWWVVRAE
ncbi:MAG: hypothetical protein WD342_12810 [Verrucomicrobiales bacterium]